MNFGFQPAPSSQFGTRLLPALASCSSALPSSSFPDLPTCQPSNPQTTPRLTPFPATLTGQPQLTEKTAALSPAFATLTSRVKHKSFDCHSYKKHPAWGYIFQAKSLSCSAFDAVSFGFGTYEEILGPRSYRSDRLGWDSQSWLSSFRFHRSRITGHGPRVGNHESPVTSSGLSLPPVRKSPVTNH